MESDWSPRSHCDPTVARAALADVDRIREHVTDRATAPWWYHLGSGLAVSLLFASLALPEDLRSIGVPTAGILLPAALMWLVNRSTGVGLDRYSCRMLRHGGTVYQLYMALFILLLAGGMALDLALGVPWAMLLMGAVMFAPTVLLSYRIERGYQRELRSAR